LPFPGLDGWQLLVTAVEAITRKKVPTKVKASLGDRTRLALRIDDFYHH
jgi:membrane-associated protease RseP (regulator of RpoE activity)